MRLDEYQWSRNPRGMHVISAFQTPVEFNRYTTAHMGWVKLVAATTDFVDDAVEFIRLGITPIVRVYLGAYGAGPFTRDMQHIVDAFISVGVKWFEFYNEPNLGIEWPGGFNPDWRNTDQVIRPLMENWLNFAEYILSRGCYPGFIPLAEADTVDRSSVLWMDAFLGYLAANHLTRFQRILNSGMYVATHPYILNHFYQEVPGGGQYSARQRGEQRAREPGWHFEYPYDPICQRNDPGRTVYGGTPMTPYGDPVGLIAMGRMFNERAATLFGAVNVPVVGTEGGIFAFRDQVYQQDTRYPAYDINSHAEATVAMFDWCAQQAPPWFFGVTLWKEDDYFSPGTAPAINRLSEHQPIMKQVPPLEVMGTLVRVTPTAPGPGPIRGEAAFHMVLLAPGLDSGWFFDTARAYWNRFRPMVTTQFGLIDLIPSTSSLAVTVIAPSDMVATMRAAIEGRYPNVWFDLIIADDPTRVRQVFDDRVTANLRFG
ncbi:MAG: hypothetical protein UZ15_CFX003000950 [Chloroflexi bacterium OLB15]|nr:MAG: hypothetical protein UZ15_CFX003000950 [Chloroflexi bacterium OLB15]